MREIAAVVGLLTCVLTVVAVRTLATPRVDGGGASAPATGAGPRSHKRRTWAWLAAVVIPGVSTGGVLVWRSRLDPVARGGGDVTVSDGAWRQRDAWVYERARLAADVTVPWKGWTHPAYASDEAVDASRATLTVAADGELAFTLHLAAGHAMAFVRRDVGPGGAVPVTGDHGGAMRGVAPLYLSAGDKVTGETASPPGRWAGVAIARRKVTP